jgi:hypothetical protein
MTFSKTHLVTLIIIRKKKLIVAPKPKTVAKIYFEHLLFILNVTLTGPNPTTSIYNAAGSQARFENKNMLFYSENRSSLLQYNAGAVAVN